MKKSLQRHLSFVIGGTILLAGLLAAVASFGLAYSEAKELQDDMLRQIATLSLGSIEQQNQNSEISDSATRVTIYTLPRDLRPEWLSHDLAAGLHTLDVGSEQLRVFVRDGLPGERTVVSQPTAVRDEIAINSAILTLLPLLLLLPVLMWLIVRIVRSELSPITELATSLDRQSADSPQPIAIHNLPQEIAPFVDAINRLLGRINHLMGQQRRFIADAAHELRTPLTALSVQAQNIQHASSLEAVHERLVPLQTGIERARKLTEQLLTLARTQDGNSGVIEINVSQLAREMIAEYLPLAESRGIDLGLEESKPLTILAAPEVLVLIIKNALENALKYTPEGGEVTIRLLSKDGCAVIEVVDNGPGIPDSERESVLDAFYRMPGTVGVGSGLGLAIAREAAIRTGGVVSLHERGAGQGLVFRYQQKQGRGALHAS